MIKSAIRLASGLWIIAFIAYVLTWAILIPIDSSPEIFWFLFSPLATVLSTGLLFMLLPQSMPVFSRISCSITLAVVGVSTAIALLLLMNWLVLQRIHYGSLLLALPISPLLSILAGAFIATLTRAHAEKRYRKGTGANFA